MESLPTRPGWDGPLSLRNMGSFHVGGQQLQLRGQAASRHVLAAGGEPVMLDPNGTYSVGQMYAQYFLPESSTHAIPLLLWHGGGLTGACWESTPDGRPGWLHYFLRQGWDTYLCDAAERGRSGYAPQVVWGAPLSQPAEAVFERFRIGRGLAGLEIEDVQARAFAEGQFPVEAFDGMVRQLVPRWTHTDEVILAAYLALLERIGPSVVACHSQGGMFGLTTAMRHPDKIRAVVALEPAAVPEPSAGETYEVPTLIILGDRIESDARWPAMKARIEAFVRRYPCVELLCLPDLGIQGNSHVLMMDKNNLQVADLANDWLSKTLG